MATNPNAGAYGKPPPIRRTFGSREAEIDYLVSHALYWLHKPERRKAWRYAERLAKILGKPTPESLRRYSEQWVVIFEARGNTLAAIRCAKIGINMLEQTWVNDYMASPRTKEFVEDVRMLEAG